MSTHFSKVQEFQLEEFVDGFESAQRKGDNPELGAYLPPADHPLFDAVLHELIRIDIEYGWERGKPRRLDEYRREYPAAFSDAQLVQELAFEEYRQRLLAGESPSPDEYGLRYRVDTRDWPTSLERSGQRPQPGRMAASQRAMMRTVLVEDLQPAAQIYQSYLEKGGTDLADWIAGQENQGQPDALFREMHGTDPAVALQLARAVAAMPRVGDRFLGFELIAELGCGAFGKVFLAHQVELARRLVAVKVSADVGGESQTLAQLLHTNIVPIYSVHHAGPFQAVCMPFCGSTTLGDLLREFATRGGVPATGQGLVSSLLTRQSTLRDSLSARDTKESKSVAEWERSASSHALTLPPSHDLSRPVASRVNLEKLEGLSYVDAILWIAWRVADGLAHAHEHGIVHRDLKPANILLSDEGQPMLLDFNLAEDTKLAASPAAAMFGGTLPYMSPEQLCGYAGNRQELDARSDIYSLGIILYELLAGRHPFAPLTGAAEDLLALTIDDRKQLSTDLRRWNPAVSPAAAAIVQRCLAPNPQDRYQSARDLQEDLRRQLDSLPLKHISEPSLSERCRKWSQRHPRLSSSASIAGFCSLLVIGLAALVIWLLVQVRQTEAEETFEQTQKDVQALDLLLTTQSSQRQQLSQIQEKGRAILDRYRIEDNPRWDRQRHVRYLSPPSRQQLRQDLGTVLFLLARGMLLEARDTRDSSARQELLEAAWRLSEQAQGVWPEGEGQVALTLQRSDLLKLMGRTEEASRLLQQARGSLPSTMVDKYLLARIHVAEGRFREGLALAGQVTEVDPGNVRAWFLQARCHEELGQDTLAIAAYNICIALAPDAHALYFNRGLARLRQRSYAAAHADLDRALALQDGVADVYFHRGLARQGLGRHQEAIDDFTKALDLGAPQTRIYFLLARAREKIGDKAGAKADFEAGMQREPKDERSWVARGFARIATDPQGALADFRKASECNPRYRPALDNQAHVLAEFLHETEEAVAVLDRIMELYPDHIPAQSSRGVLLARLGKRQAALGDAEESLRRSSDPAIEYQVAGIYALTSKVEPEDRRHAFRLLAKALRRGYGFDLLQTDRDLDPIRQLPEFDELVRAAQALQNRAGQ